ncbi:hypothetical protein MML48_5g00008303 [Holotrichia oblita]|uniref:Uncharacterized protein n=1 Tax=Holotrichia oblita TaxID=644536 RepID=A0ACB9T1G3_HOLOL|nr:hypothetical protein MML48_5g00008303 [Holotrichia oblita]
MLAHEERRLTRHQVSALIGRAWGRAATVANGVSAMKCTGIYPYDPSAIPDHYFSITDSINNDQAPLENQEPVILPNDNNNRENVDPNFNLHRSFTNADSRTKALPNRWSVEDQPSTSGTREEKESPSKLLDDFHPIPEIPRNTSKRKQSTTVLTSPENRTKRQLIAEKKKMKESKNFAKIGKTVKTTSSDESSGEEAVLASSEEISDEDANQCTECGENYYQTKFTADWIQCTNCLRWLHESCTMYPSLCSMYGRKKKRVLEITFEFLGEIPSDTGSVTSTAPSDDDLLDEELLYDQQSSKFQNNEQFDEVDNQLSGTIN